MSMKKISFAFICAMALLSFTGCKKKSGAGEAMAKMSEMTDKMCACKDKACSDKVQEDMAKWTAEQAKNATGDKAAKVSDDDMKKMAEVSKKYGDCMMKAMGAPDMGGTPPAGDKPAGDKPADPAAPAGDKPADPAAPAGDKPAGDKPADPAAPAPAAGGTEEKK
jgi:hypothetical protein